MRSRSRRSRTSRSGTWTSISGPRSRLRRGTSPFDRAGVQPAAAPRRLRGPGRFARDHPQQGLGIREIPDDATIDTFMYNLRHKIEDDPSAPKHLITVPWLGYKFQR